MIRILFITLFCPLILFGQNQEKAVFTGYVHFDFDKTEILPEAAFLLDSLGGVANPVEQFRFQITAHTDSIGNLAYNRDLSERRAKSVADVLVAKGISSEKISFSFEGETQPKTSNQTETGRQQNRRAKVELFKTPPPRKIEVFGTVTDDSTSEMLQAEILVAFRADSTKTATEEGAYNLSLSKGGKYTLTCTTPGYFYQAISDTVLILPKQGTRRVEINFTLSKLKKGRIIKLENI